MNIQHNEHLTQAISPLQRNAEREAGAPLPHPRKTLVTREVARGWSPEQFLIQRKYDGELARVKVGTTHAAGAVVLAEFMRPRSGGLFTASDRAMHARFPLGWWAAITVEVLHG